LGFVIFDIRALWRSGLSVRRQSARMSKIINDFFIFVVRLYRFHGF